MFLCHPDPLRVKILCLRVSYKKKYEEKKFASSKSLKKGVGSGSGSSSQSLRCVERTKMSRIPNAG
jgi:hypothetical protein